MKTNPQKFRRRRRFLLALPLLMLPFVTLLFWALGGGRASHAHPGSLKTDGLNAMLPEAHFKTREIWDKLNLYELAQRDSAKFDQARQRDPYFDIMAFNTQDPDSSTGSDNLKNLLGTFPQKKPQPKDSIDEKVNRKLDELYREINRPVVNTDNTSGSKNHTKKITDREFSDDVTRLERMMEMMHANDTPDPEMQQIQSVLDKILDIQHPERVKEKLKSIHELNRENAFAVEVKDHDNISLFQSAGYEQPASIPDSATLYQSLLSIHTMRNGFYGVDDERSEETPSPNVIEAIIHDTQEVVAGSTVKMRLLNDLVINGTTVHKDQFIYGQCAIKGERLTIDINSIRADHSLLPVALSVYDLDGLEGIYIPGAITRDAAKKASNDALQNLQLMSLDPSIGAQAASAGVEAAKGLFSKKAKMIKVTLKAGYHILLQDNNSI